jgi:hypothetical protein
MVNNAKRYNDPKSLLYKDACHLKKVINSTKIELENACRLGRPYAGSAGVKSREKKSKILREVAEMESFFTEALHDDEEEDEDDEEMDDDEEDEAPTEDEEPGLFWGLSS